MGIASEHEQKRKQLKEEMQANPDAGCSGWFIAKPIITFTDYIQVAQHHPGAHLSRVSQIAWTFDAVLGRTCATILDKNMCPDNYALSYNCHFAG